MTAFEFTVLGRPQPAGSKRAFAHKTTGRIIVMDDAKKSRPWKQEVAGAAAGQVDELLTGPLEVRLIFHMARPKGHYGQGKNAGRVKESAPEFPAVKPDVDKLSRAVLDALSGVVYRDDAQIVRKAVAKLYGAPERVEVMVAPIESSFGGTAAGAHAQTDGADLRADAPPSEDRTRGGIAAMRDLRAAGRSHFEIAEALGVDLSAVRRALDPKAADAHARWSA